MTLGGPVNVQHQARILHYRAKEHSIPTLETPSLILYNLLLGQVALIPEGHCKYRRQGDEKVAAGEAICIEENEIRERS